MFIRKFFKSSVDSFKLSIDLPTVDELKYAYFKLGFFVFFVFLVKYLVKDHKKKRSSVKKKNKTSNRVGVINNTSSEIASKNISKSVKKKMKKKVNKIKSKLINEEKNKKTEAISKKQSSKRRKRSSPSRLNRNKVRAVKFGSFLKLLATAKSVEVKSYKYEIIIDKKRFAWSDFLSDALNVDGFFVKLAALETVPWHSHLFKSRDFSEYLKLYLERYTRELYNK